MNKNEITVGTEYVHAYNEGSYRGGRGDKVTVLQKDVTGKNYRRQTYTGSLVRFEKNGEQAVVPNREIRELWSTFDERVTENTRQRREALRKSREAVRERGHRVADLAVLLTRKGVEVTTWEIRDNDVFRALSASMPAMVEATDDRFTLGRLHAPIAHTLISYVGHGGEIAIPVDLLEKLLSE